MFATVLFASYAALGLAASLNPNTSGGAECAASVTEARSVVNGVDNLDPAVLMSGAADRDLPIGLGRIVRDEAGRIIAVETNDDDVDPPASNHRLDLVEEAAAAAIRTPDGQSWISFGRASGAEKPNTALTQGGCGTPIASGDNVLTRLAMESLSR